MGSSGKDIPQDKFLSQYISGLYFVTTTVSTCGFGDISARQNDRLDAGVMSI